MRETLRDVSRKISLWVFFSSLHALWEDRFAQPDPQCFGLVFQGSVSGKDVISLTLNLQTFFSGPVSCWWA